MKTLKSQEVKTMPEDISVSYDVANRLFFRLYQCSNLLHKTGTNSVSEFGSTTQQWAVLGALSRPAFSEHGMTIKDLLEFLMVSRQNLTIILDRLEKSNWIERITNPEDARSRKVRLSKEGWKNWNRMLQSIESYYSNVLSDFTAEESLTLLKLLDKLKNGFSNT